MSTKLMVNGVKMERIDFECDDSWAVIKLSDGTQLKIRVRVNWIMRLVDQWDENGEPRYSVNMSTDMRFTSVPETLRQALTLTADAVNEFKDKTNQILKGKAN